MAPLYAVTRRLCAIFAAARMRVTMLPPADELMPPLCHIRQPLRLSPFVALPYGCHARSETRRRVLRVARHDNVHGYAHEMPHATRYACPRRLRAACRRYIARCPRAGVRRSVRCSAAAA